MIERDETRVAGRPGGESRSRHETHGSPAPVAVLAEGSQAVTRLDALAEGTRPIVMRPPARWPWVAGAGALVATGVTAFMLLAARTERADLETTYPVIADAAERSALAADSERWTRGMPRLLGALGRFSPPALETMTGAGACELTIDDTAASPTSDDPDAAVTTRVIVLPGEALDGLDVLARDEIDHMIAAAERGRFRTDEGRQRIVRSLASSFVVARITSSTPLPGPATGVAYAFDPATGALRCAGSFRVGPAIGESDAATQTFETSMMRSIAASLRSVD
ncbi:MAG: hypothetical protein JWP01_907 [Myxococcales bacterium]|nr:hypothetical protein [Myxococcales bacterium]